MEERKTQNAIYVGEKEEIVEIIDKIKNISGRTVTLVIPPNALILQDVTNLKILQKKSEELGKEVSVSKSDAGILPRMDDFSSQSHGKAHSGVVLHKNPVLTASAGRRMSDMVRSRETVDLRKADMNNENEEDEKPQFAKEPEKYSREKYFSDEAYFGKNTERSGFTLSEVKPESASAISVDESETEKPAEKDDIYWENLAMEKQAEYGSHKRVEANFDEHGRLDGDDDGKAFDFSYSERKPKKKKFSVLPALSARIFGGFILICLLTACVALFFILPKADIAIALKQENVKNNFSFVTDQSLSDIDADGGKIPAVKSEIASQQTQTFTTTSKKRVTEKASGSIVILNECSTGPQTLVAGTRFLSKDGKVFKIEDAVSVPGFTKPDDAVVPGQKEVKAVAEEAGEAYNIAPTTFTIPKLQELASWKYSCLYAKSTAAMSGGLDKEVNYLAQADYDKAKETVAALVQKENDDKVAAQTEQDVIYLNDKSDKGTMTDSSSVKVNAVADSFDMTVAVKKTVLSVSKKNLEALLAKKLTAPSTFENAKPVSGSLAYSVDDVLEKDSQISINVSASENFAFELDQNKIKREIGGKNKDELNGYFSKTSGIKSVSVNFWPFWVNRVPDSLNKINITLDTKDSV